MGIIISRSMDEAIYERPLTNFLLKYEEVPSNSVPALFVSFGTNEESVRFQSEIRHLTS